METKNADEDICLGALRLGEALGLLSKHRDDKRVSDLYQQALQFIPREEIERHRERYKA